MTYLASNVQPTDGNQAIRLFKDWAVASTGWSVPSSGYVAAYDTSDLWTADAAQTGNWFRLKMAGATRELLFQRKTTNIGWTVLYSVAGFTATTGDATTAPTASDSMILFDDNLLPTDGTYNWLMCAEDAAPWYLGVDSVPTGGGTQFAAIHLWPLRPNSYPTADTDPYVVLAEGNAACLTYFRLYRSSTWTSDYVAIYGYPGGWYRRGYANQGFYAALFAIATTFNASGGTWGQASISGANACTGEEMPQEIPVQFPTVNGVRGNKGYVRDARYGNTSTATCPNGTHLTGGDGRYWIRIGDLWLPWEATPPAL